MNLIYKYYNLILLHHDFMDFHVKKYVNDIEALRFYQYLCKLNYNYLILRLNSLQYVTGHKPNRFNHLQ